ncbi:MAG: hypothetical protein A2097_04350 [Desulfobacula sp. GWF2_41_7]|nr:MAG: hypothetical protein A2097_04350 [Desulfobacula sp. GWF2_41_7]
MFERMVIPVRNVQVQVPIQKQNVRLLIKKQRLKKVSVTKKGWGAFGLFSFIKTLLSKLRKPPERRSDFEFSYHIGQF